MKTRSELICDVLSVNTTLKETVKDMDNITLLRNCHPSYRGDYAMRLWKEGKITQEETKEFLKFTR